MGDVFSKAKRSRVMAAIRSQRNKGTELKLASIFRTHGIIGWRRNQRLPGKPDFVFRQERLAVFVDGCFWHGCPRHGRKPGSNRAYWVPKLNRNKRRDRRIRVVLRQAGWRVLRLWEHELGNAARAAQRVKSCLRREPGAAAMTSG